MRTIGSQIKQARYAARMTLRELARATGVSHETIRKYELGRLRPSPERLAALANAMRLPPNYFATERQD